MDGYKFQRVTEAGSRRATEAKRVVGASGLVYGHYYASAAQVRQGRVVMVTQLRWGAGGLAVDNWILRPGGVCSSRQA